jgi:hypothetical protein
MNEVIKIVVEQDKTIIVHLQHSIDVAAMAWAIVWQRAVEHNDKPLSRWQIWSWAIENIIAGRLYESHQNSEVARDNMKAAMEQVHEFFPEFAQTGT